MSYSELQNGPPTRCEALAEGDHLCRIHPLQSSFLLARISQAGGPTEHNQVPWAKGPWACGPWLLRFHKHHPAQGFAYRQPDLLEVPGPRGLSGGQVYLPLSCTTETQHHRGWKILCLIWPKSGPLQLGISTQILLLRAQGSVQAIQTWLPHSAKEFCPVSRHQFLRKIKSARKKKGLGS